METSAPMEISVQNLANGDTPHHLPEVVPELTVPSSPVPAPEPAVSEDKFLVSVVEVCLKPSSTARIEDVKLAVERMLEKRNLSYVDGPIDIPLNDTFLLDNVQRICICDTEEFVANHDILLFWQVKPLVHVYQLLLSYIAAKDLILQVKAENEYRETVVYSRNCCVFPNPSLLYLSHIGDR